MQNNSICPYPEVDITEFSGTFALESILTIATLDKDKGCTQERNVYAQYSNLVLPF